MSVEAHQQAYQIATIICRVMDYWALAKLKSGPVIRMDQLEKIDLLQADAQGQIKDALAGIIDSGALK